MNGDEAARLITDRYSAMILFAMQLRPKGAQAVSQQCGIPIAACYRRIKALETIGVVEKAERFLNQRGKWVQTYLSVVKGMDVGLDQGRIRVSITLRDGRLRTLGDG
ncbi:MAG: helix-turn-helix transcriptional regulator [Euryarchaeota archaeon]|nr:helix-turn-helix transcriptional regulator [Euryarchaeota archaeon]